jgi:hypothetical protein
MTFNPGQHVWVKLSNGRIAITVEATFLGAASRRMLRLRDNHGRVFTIDKEQVFPNERELQSRIPNLMLRADATTGKVAEVKPATPSNPNGSLSDLAGVLSPSQIEKLVAYVPAAIGLLRRHYEPECCVAATLITCLTFERLGIPCEPLSVYAALVNGDFLLQAQRTGREPARSEEYAGWAGDSGAWSVGLGFPEPDKGGKVGHVVAVAWQKVVLDLTLDQAAEPLRGILPLPCLSVVTPDRLRGERGWAMRFDWGEVRYQAAPQDRNFMQTEIWQDLAVVEPFVQELVRVVRDKCGNAA